MPRKRRDDKAALPLPSTLVSPRHIPRQPLPPYTLGLGPREGPSGSVGKESACNTVDLSSIPESGRSAGEGNGNPFQAVLLPGKFRGQRNLVWTGEPGGL